MPIESKRLSTFRQNIKAATFGDNISLHEERVEDAGKCTEFKCNLNRGKNASGSGANPQFESFGNSGQQVFMSIKLEGKR